ncbi:porin [Rhodobacteraceae bacterium XHP0102]|nr:porin [Rhodobacteraceae bacterium XHP0102]
MKKVLFATTALIATAGVASADIALTGDARMGITNTESATNVDNETQFNSRLRFTLTASGVTDGGLEFGGSARVDHYDENTDIADPARTSGNGAIPGAAADRGTAGSVFISGAFGKITMGDIDSAHESATGDLAGVGYANTQNEMGYAGGGDDTGVSYTYTIEGLTLYASVGQPNAASASDEQAFGVKYTMGDLTIAAGQAEDGAVDETSVAVSYSVAGFGLKAIVLDRDNSTTTGETGFSVTYAVSDALSVAAFTRSTETSTAADRDRTGLGFAYNLGGGATVAGSIIDGGGATNDLDYLDLGIKFAF